MYKDNRISVIIPCRNEAEGIDQLVKSMPNMVDEVVVVDNSSSDKTAKVARKAGARVVKEGRVDNRGIGYGYAYMSGFKAATGDIVVTMDGDGTYPVDQIAEVVEYMIDSDLDMLSCSRFPLHEGEVLSKVRRFGVWVLNTAVRVLYQYPMHDILSGMWVMNKKTIKIMDLNEGGWDMSPEIKLEALTSSKIKFGEKRIKHYKRVNGNSKQKLWQTGSNHLWYIGKRWMVKDGAFRNWFERSRDWPEKSVVRTIGHCKC